MDLAVASGYGRAIDVHQPVSSEMIVCSCNVLTDNDVRSALAETDTPPRTAGQVYGCLGCSPKCGRCATSIRKIMDEALDAIRACPVDCACARHAQKKSF